MIGLLAPRKFDLFHLTLRPHYLSLGLVIILALVLALLGPMGPAQAQVTQDNNFAPIGYSQGGRYFAFEEFGQHKQTDISFVRISVRDIRENRWVLGTPKLSEGLEGEETVPDLRPAIHDEMRGVLNDLRVHVPAILLGSYDRAHGDANGHILHFMMPQTGSALSEETEMVSVSLSEFSILPTLDCDRLTQSTIKGFTLQLHFGGTSRAAHRDQVLPRSRGCPIGYEIVAAYAPFQADNLDRVVVIVAATIELGGVTEKQFFPVALAPALERND